MKEVGKLILIAAVDDRYGMMFHQRRQSQDRILREKILTMTKGKTMSVLLVLSAMAVLCTGCSIKEDRSLCPCALVLDFSNVEENIVESSEVHLRAADGFLYSDPDAADGISGGGPSGSGRRTYSVRVPKTRVAVSVVSGAGSFYSADYGLRIPLGEECPPVHMY